MNDDFELEPGELRFAVSEVLALANVSVAASKRNLSYVQAHEAAYALASVPPSRLAADDTGLLIKPLKDHEVDQAKVGPALFLVKDRGCYLMSNAAGQVRDPATNTLPVAYAHGLGADADYDDLKYVCGGDDFCELIELDALTIQALRDVSEHGVVKVRLTDESIEMSVFDGKPPRGPRPRA